MPPTFEDDALFDDAMAAVVRYLNVVRTGQGWTWPGPTKPPAADIDLAVERGYVQRRVVDFPGKASKLYTEVTATGEHMLYHYPDGQHATV